MAGRSLGHDAVWLGQLDLQLFFIIPRYHCFLVVPEVLRHSRKAFPLQSCQDVLTSELLLIDRVLQVEDEERKRLGELSLEISRHHLFREETLDQLAHNRDLKEDHGVLRRRGGTRAFDGLH